MGEKSPGQNVPSVINFKDVLSSLSSRDTKNIIGQPVLGYILDDNAIKKFKSDFPPKSYAIRSESSPFQIVFACLDEFSVIQTKFNEGQPERSKRLILSKIERSRQDPTLIDSQILKDRVVLSLSLESLDFSSIKQREQLELSKSELTSAIFSTPAFTPLVDSFNEVNLVAPSTSAGKPVQSASFFYMHLQASSSEALKAFDSLGAQLKESPLSLSYRGRQLSISGCFAPKLNKISFVAPKGRAYMIRFSRTVALANVAQMNAELSELLGASPNARVVLGHPSFSPSGSFYFVTLFLPDKDAQRGLTHVIAQLDPDVLVEPLEQALSEFNPKTSRVCLHCGDSRHNYLRCPLARPASRVGNDADSRPASGFKRADSKEACRDFSRGNCVRADKCRFSHGSVAVPKPSSPPIALSSSKPGSASSPPIALSSPKPGPASSAIPGPSFAPAPSSSYSSRHGSSDMDVEVVNSPSSSSARATSTTRAAPVPGPLLPLSTIKPRTVPAVDIYGNSFSGPSSNAVSTSSTAPTPITASFSVPTTSAAAPSISVPTASAATTAANSIPPFPDSPKLPLTVVAPSTSTSSTSSASATPSVPSAHAVPNAFVVSVPSSVSTSSTARIPITVPTTSTAAPSISVPTTSAATTAANSIPPFPDSPKPPLTVVAPISVPSSVSTSSTAPIPFTASPPVPTTSAVTPSSSVPTVSASISAAHSIASSPASPRSPLTFVAASTSAPSASATPSVPFPVSSAHAVPSAFVAVASTAQQDSFASTAAHSTDCSTPTSWDSSSDGEKSATIPPPPPTAHSQSTTDIDIPLPISVAPPVPSSSLETVVDSQCEESAHASFPPPTLPDSSQAQISSRDPTSYATVLPPYLLACGLHPSQTSNDEPAPQGSALASLVVSSPAFLDLSLSSLSSDSFRALAPATPTSSAKRKTPGESPSESPPPAQQHKRRRSEPSVSHSAAFEERRTRRSSTGLPLADFHQKISRGLGSDFTQKRKNFERLASIELGSNFSSLGENVEAGQGLGEAEQTRALVDLGVVAIQTAGKGLSEQQNEQKQNPSEKQTGPQNLNLSSEQQMSPEQQVKLFSTQNACQNNIRKNPIAQKLISEKPELAQHECATGENLGDGEFGGSLSQAQSHSSALLVGVLSSSDKGVESPDVIFANEFSLPPPPDSQSDHQPAVSTKSRLRSRAARSASSSSRGGHVAAFSARAAVGTPRSVQSGKPAIHKQSSEANQESRKEKDVQEKKDSVLIDEQL